MPEKLSQHLLSLDSKALSAATQHPFLRRAAQATLPNQLLLSWLAQDRLYALSYVTFMGQLLAKVHVTSSADRTSTLNWRIVNCLIDCLTNIRAEIKLFEDVGQEHGWIGELGNARPSLQTQAYKDLFAGAGQPSAGLLRGMVTLWATEKCYLLAWSHARDHIPHLNTSKSNDVMQGTFIPNWSSKEFGEFVGVLEELVRSPRCEAHAKTLGLYCLCF